MLFLGIMQHYLHRFKAFNKYSQINLFPVCSINIVQTGKEDVECGQP